MKPTREPLAAPRGDLLARFPPATYVPRRGDAERLLELGRADRRGPRLGHHHAGRGVGEPHRVGERQPGGKRGGERRDDGIAGAGDVEDAVGLGRARAAPARRAGTSVMPRSPRVTRIASTATASRSVRHAASPPRRCRSRMPEKRVISSAFGVSSVAPAKTPRVVLLGIDDDRHARPRRGRDQRRRWSPR